MMKNKVIIGTRGSKLALWQAEWVKSELQKLHPGLEIELNKIKTTGDKILDVPLAKVGGKGLFVKEIEEAILRGDIDLAVHSMKDVPTELPEGLHLTAICKREEPRDAFVTKGQGARGKGQGFKDLPHGATIGTSSLRRACQLLSIRPDLKITQLRGNLDTRLRKLDEGQFDAIILAVAGMARLGLGSRITEILEPALILPAIGQGAIGIECRINDEFINNLINPMNHAETFLCVHAERAFLKRLEGGCQVPIAAYARIVTRDKRQETNSETSKYNNSSLVTRHSSLEKSLVTRYSSLVIDGLVGSVSGDRIVRGHIEGRPADAKSLGIKLAEDLLSRGAREILAELYGK
ncbi:MAG: hydroxymethylbilane synthase [Nitrospirae bacterium]|nr:hydroxymethylbilane synthase [Nitrospirota bacterium]